MNCPRCGAGHVHGAKFCGATVDTGRLVAEFSGPGEILIQTRSLAALAVLLKPFFPTQGGGGFNIDFGG